MHGADTFVQANRRVDLRLQRRMIDDFIVRQRLLNHHQAAYATDLEVRAVLARVAIDEAAHAELAFDIDRWAMGALSRAARSRVQKSKQAAARALRTTLRESAPSLRAVLGLPVQSALRFFALELENRLWS